MISAARSDRAGRGGLGWGPGDNRRLVAGAVLAACLGGANHASDDERRERRLVDGRGARAARGLELEGGRPRLVDADLELDVVGAHLRELNLYARKYERNQGREEGRKEASE